jgi:hypothetical protein
VLILRENDAALVAESIGQGFWEFVRAFLDPTTNIKLIPPKLAKEFAGKQKITPKVIGKREARALLREGMASTKPRRP